ncbi:MAG TPA: HDOD domain-containing protein [Burkholderiales bacterium]|nr:HDOD domain-containing protein [Burkholderiales bacterium]
MFDKYFRFLKAEPEKNAAKTSAKESVAYPLPDPEAVAAAAGFEAKNKTTVLVDTSDIISDRVITDALAIDTHGERTSTPQMLRRFVGREPILNARQQIIAYEFSLRNEPDIDDTPTLQQMRDEMLIASITDLDIPASLGNKSAFIEIAPVSLNSDWVSQLPCAKTVLALDVTKIIDIGLTLDHCRRRVGEGFRIALDKAPATAQMAPLLKLADYVRIDTDRYDALALGKYLMALMQHTNAVPIARNIAAEDDFTACRLMTFGGFQGYYFTRLQPALPQRIDNSRARVLELLNMTRRHAEINELEDVLKRDAVLSYKLLSYINAPGNGLSHKLDTLVQALILLGYNRFYRWLTLLLFTSGKLDARGETLLQNSLIRARLTETLAPSGLSAEDRDNLFVTGIFSLLDALLNTPMEQALAHLNLPDKLTQALLHDQGEYAPYLRLAIACENSPQSRIAELAQAAGLSVDTVNLAHVKALLWAEEFDC